MTTDQFEKSFSSDKWELIKKGVSFSKKYKYNGEFDFCGYNPNELLLNFEKGVLAEVNFYINVNSKNDFYEIVKIYDPSLMKVDDNHAIAEINDCFVIEMKYAVNPNKNTKRVRIIIRQNPTLIIESLL